MPRLAVLHGAGVLACAWAAVWLGGSAPARSAPFKPSQSDTEVSGVTVTVSKTPPRVASTFPGDGARIAPGLLVLRVTFDQRMRAKGWSYVKTADGLFPDCVDTPRRLDDAKSFALICRTSRNKRYALSFNADADKNFVNMGHRAAVPFELKFSTSDDEPVMTLADAMKADPALPPGSNPAEPEPMQAAADPQADAAASPPAAPPSPDSAPRAR